MSVLPKASTLFPGVIIQDVLGSCFVHVLTGDDRARQLHIPELDAYRIVDARWSAGTQGGVLMLVGVLDGQYDRLEIRFSPHFETYEIHSVSDTGASALNFVVNDAGVCVAMGDDGKLELSHVAQKATARKHVDDPFLDADLRLFGHAGRVLAARDNSLYGIRM